MRKICPAFCLRAAAAACAALLFLVWGSAAYPARADSVQDLQQQVRALEQQLDAEKKDLAALQQDTKNAKEIQHNLKVQVGTLKAQIAILVQAVSEKEDAISQLDAQIAQAEQDITARQADYDAEWARFQQRMAAMQQLHDGGSIAFLASAQSLYELLTFSEALQDISRQNTDKLDAITQEKQALEDAKSALQAQKETLEAQKQALAEQQQQLAAKQTELADAFQQADKSLSAAETQEQAAQAVVDATEEEYQKAKAAFDAANAALIRQASQTQGGVSCDGSFVLPLASYSYISTYYSASHPAIDYASPKGTAIYAAAGGVVLASSWNEHGYGYYVLLYHGTAADGHAYSTLYGHMMQPPNVSPGQQVTQGECLGYVGNTGRSYGANGGYHLHFELWYDSTEANSVSHKAQRIDPLPYLG